MLQEQSPVHHVLPENIPAMRDQSDAQNVLLDRFLARQAPVNVLSVRLVNTLMWEQKAVFHAIPVFIPTRGHQHVHSVLLDYFQIRQDPVNVHSVLSALIL